ncbi:MAG: hypothetical protein ACETWQ_08805 [Phycisphaerae bacterium]
MSLKCLHECQFCLYRVRKNVNFLRKSEYFSEIFYFYRIKYPIPKNDKSCDTKDLQRTQKGAYKPAYKNFPKTAEGWPPDLPADLTEIVAVWPELPEHIKAAIKALVQIHIEEKD